MPPQPTITYDPIRHGDGRMAVSRLIHRLSIVAVALLRLLVVPCLNARKRHARGVLPFFSDLLNTMNRACLNGSAYRSATQEGEPP